MCVDSSGSVSHVLVARAHVFLCQCAVWGSPRYAGVLDLVFAALLACLHVSTHRRSCLAEPVDRLWQGARL